MIKWKTLAKYLANEADKKEKAKVSRWINKDKDNLKAFEDIKMYWNQIEHSGKSEIDTEKAWNNLRNRIDAEEQTRPAREKPVISFNNALLRYAATILLIIGIGTGAFFTYQQLNHSAQTVTVDTPSDIRNKKVVLPDGSLVYLNYNSKLHYPQQFKASMRQVTVNGEVFFDVENNTARPFVINANNAQIEVLGTSFNVNTNLPDNKVEVLVQSGRVKVARKNKQDEHLIIKAGFKGVVGENMLKKEKHDDLNYLAWTTGRLVFKGQELEQVTNTLMRTYNVRINIKDSKIKNYKITTNFTNESIDTVLDVIATTFNLNINKIDENEYVIKNNAG
jgi:ferric-dicitrate binding protein FerR (iron transport regulator)